jgi:hypothetical protein
MLFSEVRKLDISKGVGHMKDLNLYSLIALILVLIGGINWGLVGIFDINLIAALLGHILSRVVFVIVGVAAGYLCYELYKEKFKKAV